jgi:signal transduction histidine kinase
MVRLVLSLGLVCLELYPTWYPFTTPSVVYLLYFLLSLFFLLWLRRDQGAADLLRLIVDVIVLLVFMLMPPDRTGWMVGVFYLYVLMSALLLVRLREIAMVVGVVVLFTLLNTMEVPFAAGPIVVVPGALALLAGWLLEIKESRLYQASRHAVLFRSEAENARELERQRIAADFHDGPLQSFISFQMRLEVIKKLMKRDLDAAMADLSQLQEICRKQITDMRAFVRSMRMSEDGASAATSIRQIAEDFHKTSGIQLQWSVSDALSGLEPEIAHEVLQIIREALHNAQKHSKATKVCLSAEKNEHNLQISVDDDGSGFPFGGAYSLEELELMRIGPESIKRRVRTLNGELTLESNPGRGAKIKIRIPL